MLSDEAYLAAFAFVEGARREISDIENKLKQIASGEQFYLQRMSKAKAEPQRKQREQSYLTFKIKNNSAGLAAQLALVKHNIGYHIADVRTLEAEILKNVGLKRRPTSKALEKVLSPGEYKKVEAKLLRSFPRPRIDDPIVQGQAGILKIRTRHKGGSKKPPIKPSSP